MKTLRLLFSILFATISLSCNKAPSADKYSINAIVGDISFFEKFGVDPNSETDEYLRIQTHLEYVENLLRSRDISTLPNDLKENRSMMLDLLHEYWTAGAFPRNYDFEDERVPCFIDRDGRICAVGYLIEKTAGRNVADEINVQHKYEYLSAMNDTRIDNWILTSGLTKEECAMIQPTYGTDPQYITPAYGVSTALVSGLNISMITVNGIQIAKGAKNKAVPIIGLISGTGQIALGAFGYPDDGEYMGEDIPDKRNLALMNIGIGTSTLILSAWNLITNSKPKEKSFSWNIYGYPTQARDVGIGFSLKKRL